MDEASFQPAEIIAALERHAVRYVVIGGLAATLHGSPVMTTDADICPARERDNLERLARESVHEMSLKVSPSPVMQRFSLGSKLR